MSILKKTQLLHVKPIVTLTIMSSTLKANNSENFSNTALYRSSIGALQYVTITRPNITFSINKKCQYISILKD